MQNGNGLLPAFPMRHACQAMMDSAFPSDGGLKSQLHGRRSLRSDADSQASSREGPEVLVQGLAAAIGVWYNYTGA
jgi:hypothetical protein